MPPVCLINQLVIKLNLPEACPHTFSAPVTFSTFYSYCFVKKKIVINLRAYRCTNK